MKVLVAGCGFLGERVADLLQIAGHAVTGLTHTVESAARLAALKPWPVHTADLSQAQDIHALAARIGPQDVVLHCASSGRGGADRYQAVYVDGLNHLMTAFPEAHPVFTSSTSVYGQTDGSEVDETSAAEPERETGRLLLKAEALALSRSGSVARVAGIYGPGRSFVLQNLLEGKSGIEVTATAPDGRYLNQIHRDDTAAALMHLILRKQAGVFNVVDDQPLSQRTCLTTLAEWFHLPPPADRAPDPLRKRGWTHKRLLNARLRSTGWVPQYPSYFDALRGDPDLLSSILEAAADNGHLPRAANVVLIGLMGSGKSSVGRLVAQMLGFQFVDTDHLIIEQAGCSIPEIFANEGEAGFRQRESAVLRRLLGQRHCVIATGGGIVTQARNRPLLRHLGFVTWLEAAPQLLARRTASNHDRPLLHGEEPPLLKLQRLLTERTPLYQQLADLRIQTDDLSQEESAYGVAESARIFFAHRHD